MEKQEIRCVKQKKCRSKTVNKLHKKVFTILKQTDVLIQHLDHCTLWWIGILITVVFFLPYFVLGDGCIFEINDQLDESIMNYMLPARHLWDGSTIYPEMLNGVNASGMQPSAVLFLPLYRLISARTAFLTQYIICFLAAFSGMYLLVKEITDSSILAMIAGGCFCVLPLYPVYGLSEFGIPLILYGALCLWKQKNVIWGLLITVVFGLTSHLVYTGYVVLGFWVIALVYALAKKKKNQWFPIGFAVLFAIYVLVNRALIREILFGTGSYISHREEMVSSATPFFETFWNVFQNSAQHAPSLHKYLILPIVLFLILGAFCKKEETDRNIYKAAVINFLFLIAIALFYAFCHLSAVVDWKNNATGFLHYFQMHRVYWLYPAAWYLEFAWAAAVPWRTKVPHTDARMRVGKLAVILICLLPTLQLLKVNSGMYLNVNQINNGSGITGYISWESWFAEDLMQEIDDAIGRDKSTYRVAHLGISPAPSLMHGFYTVDGYSNNYPLEYKHRFREVIAAELEKNEEVRVYFDLWGNRCYLFNSITGNYMQLKKGNTLVYEGLEFDMDALRELGCEYLFSGAEIGDADRMGLELVGYYETDDSYWGIWVYCIVKEAK